MTSVIAIKKEIDGKPVVMVGSDSQYTCGTDRLIGIKNTSKIIQFPGFVVLFSGEGRWRFLLEEMSRDKKIAFKSYMKMRNEADVIGFAKEAFTRLKEFSSYALIDETGHGELLIATPTNIYSVDAYFFTYESDHYVAGGSGATYLICSILGHYDFVSTKEELKNLVLQSLSVACKMDTSSSEPLHWMEVKSGPERFRKSNKTRRNRKGPRRRGTRSGS